MKSATRGYWAYAWHCANYKSPHQFVRVAKAVLMFVGIIP